MAIAKGGFRRSLTYKISIDSALSSTMVQDITGAAGRIYLVHAVGGSQDVYVKFYDTEPAVAGSTTPKVGMYVRASTTTDMYIPEGIPFTTSISMIASARDVDAETNITPDQVISITLVTS